MMRDFGSPHAVCVAVVCVCGGGVCRRLHKHHDAGLRIPTFSWRWCVCGGGAACAGGSINTMMRDFGSPHAVCGGGVCVRVGVWACVCVSVCVCVCVCAGKGVCGAKGGWVGGCGWVGGRVGTGGAFPSCSLMCYQKRRAAMPGQDEMGTSQALSRARARHAPLLPLSQPRVHLTLLWLRCRSYGGREWGGGRWGTRHCTIVFLLLQETHYSGMPSDGTVGPATDVRALLPTTLGALAPRRYERGMSLWRPLPHRPSPKWLHSNHLGGNAHGNNTRTDNKVARITAGTGGRSAAEDRRRKSRLRYRDRMEDGAR
jgi:hypothetical protein